MLTNSRTFLTHVWLWTRLIMPAFFCTTEFDSVEHLFFCKSDLIYHNWKWDGYLLLKVYEDGDKNDWYEYVKVTRDTSRVQQNCVGEETRIVFEEICLIGKLRPICWNTRKLVRNE